MLVSFECPLCGEFNEICIVGGRERNGFKCHGCGSKLDIIAVALDDLPEVKESEDDLEEIQNAY